MVWPRDCPDTYMCQRWHTLMAGLMSNKSKNMVSRSKNPVLSKKKTNKQTVFRQRNWVFRPKNLVFQLYGWKTGIGFFAEKNPVSRSKHSVFQRKTRFFNRKTGFIAEKPGFSIERKTGFSTKRWVFRSTSPVFQIWLINMVFRLARNPVFRSKNPVFRSRNRGFLGFSIYWT